MILKNLGLVELPTSVQIGILDTLNLSDAQLAALSFLIVSLDLVIVAETGDSTFTRYLLGIHFVDGCEGSMAMLTLNPLK